jgi:hypothetical protein
MFLTVRIEAVAPYELSPNAGKKSKWTTGPMTKALRQASRSETARQLNDELRDLFIECDRVVIRTIVWWPKGRAEMDGDNLKSSYKAAYDGIADALGVNDRKFLVAVPEQHRDPNGNAVTEFEVEPQWRE